MGAAFPIPRAPLDARHPLCNAFGALMLDRRKGRGMSLMELARITGLSDEALRRVELGSRAPTLDTAARHAEGLGLYLDEALLAARVQKLCQRLR